MQIKTRWALGLVCFVRLWLMPIGSSFWVDEMASIYVVEHGADDPSLKVAPQLPQSIYHDVVRLARPGRSEIGYRLPSILFMGVAVWLVALLTNRLIHPDAGWFAVFACFSLKGINYQAGNARPYALGVCVAMAGLYFLARWLDRRRLWDAILFVIFAALLWRVHLIFWAFYVVFVVGALFWRKQMPWWQLAVAFGAVGLLLIPEAMKAIELNAHAKDHVVTLQPSLMDLARSFRFLLVVGAGLGAWIWSRFAKSSAIAASTVVPVLAWWLWTPVALYAFSKFTGNSVFTPRNMELSLPGTAVAATMAAAMFLPARFWKPAALLMGVCALISAGNWTTLWPHHHNSDWRAATRAVNDLGLPPSTPIICPSPFIEAKPPEWTPDYKLPGFLYAHLSIYPVRGNVALFPFEASPEAEDYAVALVQGAIPASGQFVIYGTNSSVDFWTGWFERRSELGGWSHRQLGRFDDVEAVLFEKAR